MNKVVLLDRDGVINQDSFGYIKSVEEFVPLPGSMEAIGRLTQVGYQIGVATNQSGVARGLYSEAMLQEIHKKMRHLAQLAGGEINAIEYCIHMPDAGCLCRKPGSGMLSALAKKLGCTNLEQVPFLGDRISDIQAAHAVGAKPVIILSTMTDRAALSSYPLVPVFHSLSEWVDYLLLSQCISSC
jgi:D-glycero-D-manno-heptose 1,7-bisphosphate phosphatase